MMMNSTTFARYQPYSSQKSDASTFFSSEVKHWCYLIGLPIVGLLALLCFLSLGGVFAVVGPWLILAGVKMYTRRLYV